MPEELGATFGVTSYVGTVPIFPEVYILVAGFLDPSDRYCLAEFLGARSWSLVSLLIGGPKFLEVLICDVNHCTGNYYPSLLVLLFLDEEGLAGQ